MRKKIKENETALIFYDVLFNRSEKENESEFLFYDKLSKLTYKTFYEGFFDNPIQDMESFVYKR